MTLLKRWLVMLPMMMLPLVTHAQVDTAAILKRAKEAQRKFEQLHRSALPTQLSGTSTMECDAIIGRICYWNDTGEVKRPEEPAKITKARLELVNTLDKFQSVLYNNDWMLGQYVAYMIRAGKAGGAALLVGTGTPWWMAALRGYGQHSANWFENANRDFDEALKLMPVKQRCEWNDLSLLLPKDQRKIYRKLNCTQREDVNERIWLLADPLYSTRGNERRSAHYSRIVSNIIQRNAEPTQDMSWGKDMEEVVLRYGPATYYTRSWTHSMAGSTRTITGHDAARNYHYLPVAIPYTEAQMKEAARWDLTARTAQEGYSTPAYTHIIDIVPQIAIFKRDTNALIVASHNVKWDSAAVALVKGGGILNTVDAPRKYVSALTPWHPQMIGVEVLDSRAKRAARYRTWWVPSQNQISDILLSIPRDTIPVTTPDDAMKSMLPSLQSNSGDALGLYWEMYDVSGTSIPVTLTLSRLGDSGLRRFFSTLGLARRHTPLAMKWTETPASIQNGMLQRSLIIHLSNVPEGRYRLKISAQTPSNTVSTFRDLEIN